MFPCCILEVREALFFWQCAFVLLDLQPVTWGHCRKRWCESGASHHRDKQPECCGCSPREDSESACHFCWRSKCAISWLQYQLEAHMKAWELVHETNIPCPDQVFCACRYSWRQCQHPCSGCWQGKRHPCTSSYQPQSSHCVSSQSCLANSRSTPAFSSSSWGCFTFQRFTLVVY